MFRRRRETDVKCRIKIAKLFKETYSNYWGLQAEIFVVMRSGLKLITLVEIFFDQIIMEEVNMFSR